MDKIYITNQISIFVLISMLCLSCRCIAADTEQIIDMPLEKLLNMEVISASRFKQKSSEAPSAVDVVTADDIRNFGWRTLADALSAMRGLHVRNDRAYQRLGNRGFLHDADFNSRILLMVDGRRMNDNLYDNGFLGEDFIIDMNLIERIEYIPGSGSSLYGGNALVGVINVITKQGKDLDGLRISGEAGSLDSYRGRATYGKHWRNGADLLLNASQYYSQGAKSLYFPEFSDTNGGVAENADREHSRRIFGQLSYQDFTLRGGYVSRFKRNPTAAFGTIFNDPDTFNKDQQSYVDLDYNTTINRNLGLELRGFYHRYDSLALNPLNMIDDIPINRVVETKKANGRWWGGEGKLTGTMFEDHKWTLGLEFQYDQKQALSVLGDPFDDAKPTNRHGWRSGFYLQDEYRINNQLLINAGVRLDQHHMIKNIQINPRAAIVWDVTNSFTAKLLYSSAFRAPNVYERDFNNLDFGFRANPNNAEEHIKSYEGIMEWRPGYGYRLMGTAFYNRFTDLLEHQEQDTSFQFTNAGKFHSIGFELEAEKRWLNGRLLKLAWTYADVRDDDQNGIVGSDAPKNQVKFHFNEPLLNETINLGIEEIFVDQRRTLGSNIAPSYHLLNINLSLSRPIFGIQAGLSLYNVLDQHYLVLGGTEHVQDTLAMDGRTLRFRVEYGF